MLVIALLCVHCVGAWPVNNCEPDMEYYDPVMMMCMPCEELCLRGPKAARMCHQLCPAYHEQNPQLSYGEPILAQAVRQSQDVVTIAHKQVEVTTRRQDENQATDGPTITTSKVLQRATIGLAVGACLVALTALLYLTLRKRRMKRAPRSNIESETQTAETCALSSEPSAYTIACSDSQTTELSLNHNVPEGVALMETTRAAPLRSSVCSVPSVHGQCSDDLEEETQPKTLD